MQRRSADTERTRRPDRNRFPAPKSAGRRRAGKSSWGGARPGAGRKPSRADPLVTHDPRPPITAHLPVYATVPLAPALPAVHRAGEREALEQAIAAGAERLGFAVVHCGIEPARLHFLLEVRSTRALSKGMQGLLVRAARALNRLWGRHGTVFADRYEARVLRTPEAVRAALARAGASRAAAAPALTPASTWLLRRAWSRAGRAGAGRGIR